MKIRRQEQETEEWKEHYQNRAGIEGTILQAIRVTDLRQARYRGLVKTHLQHLLEEGVLPHRKVGKHRRVLMEDVMNYKRAIDQEREAVLDKLVADAQEHDMGYE